MNRWISECVALVCALAALAVAQPGFAKGDKASDAEANAFEAVVEQPRSFGYVLGDVFTQRVLLQAGGASFEPVKLPGTQRVGVWLLRRASRIETATDGRRWLAIEYQLINAPHALTTVHLPPVDLIAKQGGARLWSDPWPISVAPLTPREAFDSSGFGELRPDRQAAIIATGPMQRQALFWAIALVATLAAWFAWTKWRDRLAAMNQPFARAWNEVMRLDDAAPQAWQALHRAFDGTAGKVVHADTLPALFERVPHLQSLRPQIERFFTASSDRFFGGAGQTVNVSVRSLCDELRRLERQHER